MWEMNVVDSKKNNTGNIFFLKTSRRNKEFGKKFEEKEKLKTKFVFFPICVKIGSADPLI